MNTRPIAGALLALAALRPLQAALFVVVALATADWSDPFGGGAFGLIVVIVVVVGLMLVAGIGALVVGIRYLRGRTRARLPGLIALLPNGLIALVALADTSGGDLERMAWIVYAVALGATLVLLLLPAPRAAE